MKITLPDDQTPPPLPDGQYELTVASINRVWGEISRYGTKTTPDGKTWVVHGSTGLPVERHEVVPVAQDDKGYVIYLKKGEKMPGVLGSAHPSIWKNP